MLLILIIINIFQNIGYFKSFLTLAQGLRCFWSLLSQNKGYFKVFNTCSRSVYVLHLRSVKEAFCWICVPNEYDFM